MASKHSISSTDVGPGRLFRLVFAFLVLAVILVGCGDAPEVTADDPVLQQGRELYVRNCAGCHGISGGGASGPKLADGAATTTFPNLEDQVMIVTDGRDRMPGFANKLSDDEIEAVVRYTREVL